MIRYSVFYPSAEGSTFDHDYYRETHVPLAVATWSPESFQIDVGLDGPFVGGVHVLFASREAFDAAMALPGTADVRADVPRFTNITPIRQVSETS